MQQLLLCCRQVWLPWSCGQTMDLCSPICLISRGSRSSKCWNLQLRATQDQTARTMILRFKPCFQASSFLQFMTACAAAFRLLVTLAPAFPTCSTLVWESKLMKLVHNLLKASLLWCSCKSFNLTCLMVTPVFLTWWFLKPASSSTFIWWDQMPSL